jgi:anaerobic selenocysteine-containing dehydrogenase/Fe-S-cluster-containing dehydrogenase component
MSTDSEATGVKRRDFLKILGVTTAATAVTGCSSDHVRKLIPYVTNPDNTVPGVSNYFASTCRECATSCGILVETRDGRALKVEGNPNTDLNRGALCAKGQSALQGLYNPDRFRQPMARKNGKLVPITWDEALQTLATRLGEARSKGQAASAVFINQHESGSFPAFLDGWLASYGMPAHISYDADAPASAITANKAAHGVAWPSLDFDAASLIVSFGADFLDGWGPSVPLQLAWADARAKIEGAPRAIYIGARRSLTGLNADSWIACKPGSELAIIQFLRGTRSVDDASKAADVSVATLDGLKKEISGAKRSLLLAGGNSSDATQVATEVAELNKSLGNVGITVKSASPLGVYERLDSTAAVLNVADRMNAGAVPVLFVRGANPVHTLPKSAKFAEGLAKVGFKVSFTNVPDETTELADLILPDHHSLESWGDAEPTANTLHLQQPAMEPVFASRATADVLMDVAKKDPALATKYPMKAYRNWLVSRFPGGQAAHTVALAKGVAAGSSLRAAPRAAANDLGRKAAASFVGAGDFHLVINASPTLGTGAGANKPWLMELPDPVSKIAWQSWVEMHPMACKKLGVTRGDLVTIETAAGKVTLPVYNYLGIRPDTVAVSLGYGHKSQSGTKFDTDGDRTVAFHSGYGRYAEGVGINAVDLVGGDTDALSGAIAYSSMKAKVTRTGENIDLITTEGSARQHSRGIGQATTLAALVAGRTKKEGAGHGSGTTTEHDGETAQHEGGLGPKEWGEQEHEFVGGASHEFLPGLKSPVANDAQGDLGDQDSKAKGMYSEKHWSGMAKRRWAMTVDLSRCTGCSACVTACYSENNIPTVGASWQGRALSPTVWDTRPGANILKGREMAWIRLERYFEGADDAENVFDPVFDTRFVPMMCQHCGNAPCEPVCPVYATYHSPDGLNVQVYNRCVGTRYCSNNCPYKVRYYNWFGYGEPGRRQYAFPEPMQMQLNPDVTVRGKGVMEKCTFCVQRIREAETRADLEHRPLMADEFTTACAQACPSKAITFGDAADPTWTVAKQVEDERAYHVFEVLNTYTAVVYLKKINHTVEA